MVTAGISEDLLLKAFEPEDPEWHTSRELQHLLEINGYRASIEELIDLAEELERKQYLEVVFIEPVGQGRTGFAARMRVAGRKYRRGIL
jgi:hypothetical protein